MQRRSRFVRTFESPDLVSERLEQSVRDEPERERERDLDEHRGKDARQLLVAAPRQRDVEPGVAQQERPGDDERSDDELTHAPSGPRSGGEPEGQRHVEADPRDAPLVRGVPVGQRHRQHNDPRRQHHGRAGRRDEGDETAPAHFTRHRGRHRALRQPPREEPPLVLVQVGHFGTCRDRCREPRGSLHVAHSAPPPKGVLVPARTPPYILTAPDDSHIVRECDS